jgi:hypothetical protein
MAMKLMLSLELQAFEATIDAVDHDEIMPVCYFKKKSCPYDYWVTSFV